MFVNSFRSFLRDDFGAVTIEFVTLVPMFILMLIFFTDVSMVYLTRTEMWNTARDVSRRMAIDQFTTTDQVNDYIASHLFLGDRDYAVTADFSGNKAVQIDLPIIEAGIFGAWLRPITGETLSVYATMGSEPHQFVIGDPL